MSNISSYSSLSLVVLFLFVFSFFFFFLSVIVLLKKDAASFMCHGTPSLCFTEWIHDYSQSFVQPDTLQQAVDNFMNDYDRRKEEVVSYIYQIHTSAPVFLLLNERSGLESTLSPFIWSCVSSTYWTMALTSGRVLRLVLEPRHG